jgi:GNAT superfamily N-acetyltransferase
MVDVSPATVDDLPALVLLFSEMDEFYGESSAESFEAKERNIRAALFDSPPSAHALIARGAASALGVACYSFLWPAVLTSRSLYLKELYVAKDVRQEGVGSALMGALFDVARSNDCSRVEWTTDSDNHEARAFYSRLSFEPLPSKIFYRADVPSSATMAASSESSRRSWIAWTRHCSRKPSR